MTITTIEKDGLFYNFHYIGNNSKWWHHFAKQQNINSRDIAMGGVLGFLHSLPNVDCSHVWVAYISNTAPKKHFPLDDEIPTIEMVTTVTTSELSCFSMHMGIFRSTLYTGEKHPNISMRLHGFAAEQITNQSFDMPKIYMVTTPLDHMRDIMQQTFALHEKQIYTDQDKHIFKINSRGKNSFHSLLMYDQEGNEIFNWNTNNSQLNQNMSWFSDHRDVFGTPNPFIIARLADLMSVGGFAPASASEEAEPLPNVENILISYCDEHKIKDVETCITNVKEICGEDVEALGKLLEIVDAQIVE
jgi:hypothetical protein